MNRELIEYVKGEIKEARQFFTDDNHFDEVFDQSGWGEEEMRVFDCGYVKALEHIMQKLEENK